MDLTVEMPSVEEAESSARKAIDAYRNVCKDSGLVVVPTPGAE